MASVTFEGPWHELDKQKVTDDLARLFERHPRARVVCIHTGNQHDPYRAQVWDGPEYKTLKPVEVYTLGVIAKHIAWCLEE